VHLIHQFLTPFFELFFFPFRGADPLWGLIAVSLLTAALALLIYRWFSAQARIRRVKELLKAHILEIRLFQQDPVLTGRAVLSVLKTNLLYLRLNLKPFLIMFLPVMLILIQTEARLGYRPLAPGESVLVRTFWQTEDALLEDSKGPRVEGQGVSLASPPLRIRENLEIDWKIRVTDPQSASLTFLSGQGQVSIPIRVSDRMVPISTWNGRKGSFNLLLHPAAQFLPHEGDLVAVEIDYPRRDCTLGKVSVHWIWPFLALTLAAGYLCKGFFKVQL